MERENNCSNAAYPKCAYKDITKILPAAEHKMATNVLITRETDVVNIEAFDTNLFGKIILYQKHTNGSDYHRLPPIKEKCVDLRQPYKRRLLICNSHNKHINNTFFEYDTIFNMHDISDWSLVLTYIVHSPKPLFILIDNVMIPNIVWTKFQSLKGNNITIVHIANTPVQTIQSYNAIFFQPIVPTTPVSVLDIIYGQIQSVKHSYSMREFKETIAELRIADAGLCIINHTEMYWYDPVENDVKISPEKMSEILRWLAGHC